jgi:hypothetical protein
VTDPGAVTIRWSPEPPANRKRWEAEIRSALTAPLELADVEMVQDGNRWRVQTATASDRTEVRGALIEYLVAIGFPVCS